MGGLIVIKQWLQQIAKHELAELAVSRAMQWRCHLYELGSSDCQRRQRALELWSGGTKENMWTWRVKQFKCRKQTF
jgi:hypothetical protein